MQVAIPGFGTLGLEHLVLDYNGTLAVDGRPRPGAKPRLRQLARLMRIHVLTADTFGKAREGLRGVDCKLEILESDRAKAAYVRRLGASRVACIGNGRNDRLMLRIATLGIAIVQVEGVSAEAVASADLLVPSIGAALDLFLRPRRLIASLRS